MKLLAMAWRALWRDARAGELRLLWVAVSLGVAALTSVGYLADRIEGGLQRDARQLLGGDAVLASDHPLAPEVTAKIQALGLQSASTLSFPTMARSSEDQGGNSRLVALKVVSDGYPLRGRLQILPPADASVPKAVLEPALNNGTPYDRPGMTTDRLPQEGEVWAEPALLEALELKPGDEMQLGERTLRITEVLMGEPDRGAGFMNFAPRVMIQRDDLAATGLVQPASRLTYRQAVAGEGEPMAF
jgi:putative ABC transport system permease protein